jgi:uncharacterized protein
LIQHIAVLGLGKVLYDPAHQPYAPEGWIFRVLLSLAALMRSFGALLAIKTSAVLLGLPLAPMLLLIPMPRRVAQALFQAVPDVVMGLIVSWLLLRFAHNTKLRELGLEWNSSVAKETLLAFIAGAVALAMTVVPLLMMGMGRFEAVEMRAKSVQGLVMVSAFAEELILRGYVFQTLAYPMHLLGALVLTSGAFAALHLRNPGANEYTMANTFLAGCVLGLLLVWRRSIWVVSGAHFGWNLMTMLLGLNVSGGTLQIVPYRIQWSAETVWTGGNYGPEGSVLCMVLLSLLLLVLVRLHYHREA